MSLIFTTKMAMHTHVFEGSNFLRQRLILATLTSKPLKITNIRNKDDEPGIKDYEANLLKLIDKVSNGSTLEINETGTSLYYKPGMLYGGKLEHDCGQERSIGYFLEVLVCLAPFCKKPIEITLRGITNDQIDPSVDLIKSSVIPVLKSFVVTDEGLELKIVSRGMPPEGGGEVFFSCPVRKQLKSVQFLNPGKIKRIRGVAYATRVSPATANRMVESAKGMLLKFLPDVYIHTDVQKGKHSGKSPGFGLTLVAETTNGAFLAAEAVCNSKGSDKGPSVPEDVAQEAASRLLEEIYRGGCIDSTSQSMACLFMALGQQNVSKILTGPLSNYTIEMLRHIKEFLQIMFKLDVQTAGSGDEEESLRLGADKVVMTCLGVGFTNLSKTTR